MNKRSILLSLLTIFSLYALAQKQSVFLIEENDYFNKTDRYYTNGTGAGISFQSNHAPFFSSFLPVPKSKAWHASFYSVQIMQKMFTPSSINHNEWQQNDVPYAGILSLTMAGTWINETHKLRLTPSLNVGILGPQSYAAETQTWFHQLIHSELPQGWRNQLPAEPVLEYVIGMEKVVVAQRFLDITLVSKLVTGTLLNETGIGISAHIGKPKPWNTYWFELPSGYFFNVVLEGGYDLVFSNRLTVFNRADAFFEPNVFHYAYGLELTTPIARISFITKTQSKVTQFTSSHRFSSILIHMCLS